jgi:hypothetical protein
METLLLINRERINMDKLVMVVLASLVNVHAYSSESSFQQFSETCADIKIVKASVSASCTAENGGVYKTSLRLRGVNNANATLRIDSDTSTKSYFHHDCKRIAIIDGVLEAKCKDTQGNWRFSSLDLTPFLKNYNGTLVYQIK